MRVRLAALLLTAAIALPACIAGAEEATDLTGIWRGENEDGSKMEIVIRGDALTLTWIADDNTTSYVYWAGTYEAPTEVVEDYSWVSEQDADQTDKYSPEKKEETKEFLYSEGTIRTEVSLTGETTLLQFEYTDEPETEVAAVTYDTDYELMYYQLQQEYQELQEKYEALLAGSPAEEAEETVVPEQESESEGEIRATRGENNALQMAWNYLRLMHFSYAGLIEQLEEQNYTTEEAVFAADHCEADWNEQAVGKAQEYLDLMPLSREELVMNLEYDGFTTSQAEYAADALGY